VVAPYGMAIRFADSAYALDAGPVTVDAQRFRTLAEASSGSIGDSARRTALDLWRGDPLGEVDEHLRTAFTAGLLEVRLQVQTNYLQADVQSGRFSEAMPLLRHLVTRHPTHEGLVALLMVALAGTGRRAEALGAYLNVKRQLADELGLDPGLGLTRLY